MTRDRGLRSLAFSEPPKTEGAHPRLWHLSRSLRQNLGPERPANSHVDPQQLEPKWYMASGLLINVYITEWREDRYNNIMFTLPPFLKSALVVTITTLCSSPQPPHPSSRRKVGMAWHTHGLEFYSSLVWPASQYPARDGSCIPVALSIYLSKSLCLSVCCVLVSPCIV